jgi:hypothetical protein
MGFLTTVFGILCKTEFHAIEQIIQPGQLTVVLKLELLTVSGYERITGI